MSLECARQEIRRALNDAAGSGALDQGQADEAFARIDCATSIEDAARRAHIVMETGPDEAESKLEMFCLLDRICLPNTVIVSNSHALDLSDTSAKAESIVGMYFSGDQAEIHCSAFTGERALAVAKQLAERMASSYTHHRDGHSRQRLRHDQTTSEDRGRMRGTFRRLLAIELRIGSLEG